MLPALAAGELKKRLPHEGRPDRAAFSCLEAYARLLLGLAPWLELEAPLPPEEKALQERCRNWALEGLAMALDPASPDRMNFREGQQPLVDAAFLCSALLRAPKALLSKIPAAAKPQLVEALQTTRRFKPYASNWLLFSAMVECGLAHLGAEWSEEPVETALARHEEWYLGDGAYGDGPGYAWDYYNSFVIHPLLIETLEGIAPRSRRWAEMLPKALERARRYAEVQERLISPEGSFPPLGRSLCYRAGAFHHLAFMAWRRDLPSTLKPAGVRCALSAVLRRQMEMPGTFDKEGWLTLGFAGHQPGLAEDYLCTGSAYLASAALLPLGLGPEDEFWAGKDEDWTAKKLWSGGKGPRDQALKD